MFGNPDQMEVRAKILKILSLEEQRSKLETNEEEEQSRIIHVYIKES